MNSRGWYTQRRFVFFQVLVEEEEEYKVLWISYGNGKKEDAIAEAQRLGVPLQGTEVLSYTKALKRGQLREAINEYERSECEDQERDAREEG